MAQDKRTPLNVHVGNATDEAVLLEWWKPLDGAVETRSIRFYERDKGLWLEEDDLPQPLRLPGSRITEVVGVGDHPGRAALTVGAGQPLHLQPEPRNPQDPNAIGVFTQERVQIGYLPGDVAAETIAESHRVRSAFGALIVTEHRNAESGERIGIKVLIGPGRVWAEQPPG